MKKKFILTILALTLAIMTWFDVKLEWLKNVLSILFLIGIWIPDKK